MRNILILIYLPLILISCSNVNQYEIDLIESTRTIHLNIREDNKLHSKAIFAFSDKNGSEYLSFEGRNSIDIYELSSGCLIKTFEYDKEGPNGVGEIFGHYPVNLDSIYLCRRGFNELFLINDEKMIVERYSYNKDNEGTILTPAISASIVNTPLVEIDKYIYLNQALPYGGMTTGDMLVESPVSIIIDKESKEVRRSENTFPRLWENKDALAFFEYSRVFDGDKFIYSFFGDENIYISNIEHNIWETKQAKSDRINQLYKKGKRDSFDRYIKWASTTPRYGNITYDKYRNLYYRFSFPEHDDSSDKEKKNRSDMDRAFSIIILDENLDKIGETHFPKDKYAPSLFFVSQEGLCLSTSNANNTQEYSEDLLTFRLLNISNSDTLIYDAPPNSAELINPSELIMDDKFRNWPSEDPRRVAYSFIVEKDGSISAISLEKGESEDMNKEALRLIEKGKYKPATLENGCVVRQKVVYLTRFPQVRNL